MYSEGKAGGSRGANWSQNVTEKGDLSGCCEVARRKAKNLEFGGSLLHKA